MASTEPEIVNVRYLPDGSVVDIFGGFTRKSLEIYPCACKALAKHNDGSLRYWGYVHDVLDGADHARAWRRARDAGRPDPNEARRQEDLEFLKAAPSAAAAGLKFLRFLQRWPDRTSQIAGRALLEIKGEDGEVPLRTLTSGADKVNVFAYGPGSHTDVLLRVGFKMVGALEKRPPAKAGPWMHRGQVGPLLYPHPIDGRSARPDALVDGLLFGTVLLSRQFTAPSLWGIQAGMVMPTPKALAVGQTTRDPGRPLWPVAAAIVKDALGEDLTDDAARVRIKILLERNPRLGWGGWPPPPGFFDRYS